MNRWPHKPHEMVGHSLWPRCKHDWAGSDEVILAGWQGPSMRSAHLKESGWPAGEGWKLGESSGKATREQ